MMQDVKATPDPSPAERASDAHRELAVAATLPALEAVIDGPPLPAPGQNGAADMPDEKRAQGREQPGNERDERDEADTRVSQALDVPVLPKPRLDGLVDEVEQARVFEALFQCAAHEPQQFGHYVVLDLLGQGGMGVVLRAYDGELDRLVAIKVLHRGLDERHTQRLRREAQAMAKLSHPNVVQVYEVGKVEGQTFVAMELVKGKTLREWMLQEPRPGWRACVELFVQVGAGLAAAHECGLVHRDFKPGNATVDDKGRARVLDFGLARRDDEVDEVPSVMLQRARTDSHAVVSLETSLTATGVVLGTPAYMPPEQMGGLEVDARSDQFSFCVSLYEAVYGERPYKGGSMEEIMMSVRTGSVRPVPKGSDVPVALRRVLLRGLSVEPAQRWPSMAALLEELRRLASPRRRRWMVLAVSAGLVAVGGGVGATQTLEWWSRCTGARKQLEGAWDEERRQEVKAAILGTELSYAPGTWERVELRLDEYAYAWASAHTETCEATRSRGEQSEEDMSLRMGCLRERRQHLQATVNELAQADAKVVENAVQSVTSLPGLDRCADVEALRAEVPPPEDPEMAEQVDVLDEQLVEARAKEKAGKYEEGLRLVDEVVEKGEALEYEPLMARAWLWQGHLRGSMGDYEGAATALRHACGAAVARRMSTESADASAMLMIILGYRLARYEEASHWAEIAEPLARATGADDALATYFNSVGVVAESQGKYDEARVHHEQSLALSEKALGPDHPSVAHSLICLGRVEHEQGKYDEARVHYERALTIWENALGPDHPSVAGSFNNLGNVANALGKYAEARAHFERALPIWEKALGPDHPNVAVLLNNLGNVALGQGKYAEARAHFERALAIWEKALGPDHPHAAHPLNNLGIVANVQGKYDEARGFTERALAIWEKALGPDHPYVALSLTSLGYGAELQGKYDEARGFTERALAIQEKAFGPDHPNVAVTLSMLGNMALEQGKYNEARGFTERALALKERAFGPDHPSVASTLTVLGKMALEKDKYEEARAHYERALAIEEGALGPNHPDVADSLVGMGTTLLALAKPADALAPLERALTIRTTHDVDAIVLAETRFFLAHALWDAPAAQGRDRPRAHALAEQARDAYAAAGEAKKTKLAELEAWLAKHRLP
jgi:eukaryotic-like serine/threonine-protein kinase